MIVEATPGQELLSEYCAGPGGGVHLAREDDEGGLDGVGHGGGVVGKHLTEARRGHVAGRGVVRGRHNPVDGISLLAAVPPCTLHTHTHTTQSVNHIFFSHQGLNRCLTLNVRVSTQCHIHTHTRNTTVKSALWADMAGHSILEDRLSADSAGPPRMAPILEEPAAGKHALLSRQGGEVLCREAGTATNPGQLMNSMHGGGSGRGLKM